MYQPKNGDRVRVVLEGTASVFDDGFDIGGPCGNFIVTNADHVVSIELLAPAEPPVGSVVLDKVGDAAQRVNEGKVSWRYAVSEDEIDVLTWSELVDHYGPVKILHTPDSA